MTCWLRNHEWGWPRRRGGEDKQVCVRCGSEQVSRIQFRRVDDEPVEYCGGAGAQRTSVHNGVARLARLVRL
jgi:hypothetical protein